MPLPQYTSSSEGTQTSSSSQSTGNQYPKDSVPAAEVSDQKSAVGDTGFGQEKSEEQKEADRLYEERIEEEYAKREGGA